MARVLIVYFSQHGNTQKMAIAVGEGVKKVEGSTTTIKSPEDVTKEDLLNHDALIFGSPVHMGSPDWRLKKLIDELCGPLWMKDQLVGKVGAVFASGGGFGNGGGGSELTMLSLLSNFAALGMILVPLPKNTPSYKSSGIQWGPYGHSLGEEQDIRGVRPESLVAAEHHGMHVAKVADALKGKKIF